MKDFTVDPAFEAGSQYAVNWPLCQVRVQNDARFCWLILIPRVDGAVELSDLTAAQRIQLMDEMIRADEVVRAMAADEGLPVDKINSAALGNVTRQLHVHVLGRRHDDPCWPDPVWGRPGAISCSADRLRRRLDSVARYQFGL